MWPLTAIDISFTRVEKMERMISSYVRKWLGALQCLNNISLYGHGMLEFPVVPVTTTLRPELVLWSNTLQIVYLIELTVPWEDATEEENERKRLQYTEMANNAHQQGWKISVHPVEVGSLGFVAASNVKLLKDLGIHGQTMQNTVVGVCG